MDYLANDQDGTDATAGAPFILPSNFLSGPRFMKQNYEDAMAMVNRFGKPDWFITFTVNPKHPDIVNNLGNDPNFLSQNHPLTALDRPDIVAAVFKGQLIELKQDLKTVLGEQEAYLHVIEYQKRGLPHAHILNWVKSAFKPRTAMDIDKYISAELPLPGTPEYDLVTDLMIHHFCGPDTDYTCMQKVKGVWECSKHFPQDFQPETIFNHKGYPIYRRRNNGRVFMKKGKPVDNRWVVPFSPWLLMKYKSHINIQAVTSVKILRYLLNYVTKGHDCANLVKTNDEIKNYLDCRYVSAPEAMWRLNSNSIIERSHTIQRLDVHLENEQRVTFRTDENVANVLQQNRTTKLTAWFDLNQIDEDAHRYFYHEIPQHYIFTTQRQVNNADPEQAGNKKWVKRKRRGDKTISRMYRVDSSQRERFFLRVLLLHVKGCKSFEDIRTFEGIVHATYFEACKARGLMVDDTEWERALDELCAAAFPRQIRMFFATLLGANNPFDPLGLWNKFKSFMYEDYVRQHLYHIDSTRGLSDDQIRTLEMHALNEIDSSLRFNYNKSVTHYGLPAIDANLNDLETFAADIDSQREEEIFQEQYSICNNEQRAFLDKLIQEIISPSNGTRCFFLEAPAGCGKTMVCSALINKVLSLNKTFATCATTGIAATLMRKGVTAHSLFKLGFDITETSTCFMKSTDPHALYLRDLDIIFIDEATMMQKHVLRMIDVVLRDIMHSDVPFGGKLLVLSGDFRQTLPVIQKAHPAVVLEHCINRSPLWRHFKVIKLTQNMRARPEEAHFANWLVKLGNKQLTSDLPNAYQDLIDLPQEVNLSDNIVDDIHTDLSSGNMRGNSIVLCSTNANCDLINSNSLSKFKPNEESRVYFSVDSYIQSDDNELPETEISVEFMNKQNMSGLPRHKLELKKGCPVILLRNIDRKNGLVNGTRLIVEEMGARFISATVTSGSESYIGKKVFIPKMKLQPSNHNLPFQFERLQFPLKLCFSMTINKSQGQSFSTVGIYLTDPVFAHGQLYVAFSRATAFSNIYVQFHDVTTGPRNDTKTLQYQDENSAGTINVVYNVNI